MPLGDLRPVEEGDRGQLLTASYSKLDFFQQCQYRYRLKYIESNFDDSMTVSLNLGRICHKILELKARAKIEGKDVDYDYLTWVLHNGWSDSRNAIWGIDKISTWYFDEWNVPDNKSGMTYAEKMQLFMGKVIHEEMEDSEWHVKACEQPFEFVYKDEMILHGFIDRVDENEDGDIRIIDYKTSKAAYEDSKLKTPLQMVIYGLASIVLYGREPHEYWYRFVLIDDRKQACSSGYMKRAIKKIDSTFDAIEKCKQTGVYQPSPGPLCYWCPYCASNPNAEVRLQNKCPYYSLWTPNNKMFSVNREYNAFFDRVGDESHDFIF